MQEYSLPQVSLLGKQKINILFALRPLLRTDRAPCCAAAVLFIPLLRAGRALFLFFFFLFENIQIAFGRQFVEYGLDHRVNRRAIGIVCRQRKINAVVFQKLDGLFLMRALMRGNGTRRLLSSINSLTSLSSSLPSPLLILDRYCTLVE